LLDSQGDYRIDAAVKQGSAREQLNVRALPGVLERPEHRDVDVVLLCLHGGAGENGTLQCLLDLAGIRYTGSGMKASAVAMDKAMTKKLAAAEGVPVPASIKVRIGRDGVTDRHLSKAAHRFTLPVIVKPNDSGSTVGLTRVERVEEMKKALETAAGESSEVLIEQYIKGRELTVSVLDGEALPVVEIKPKKGLYDYESKYTRGMSEYIAPAEIADDLAAGMQRDAVKTYHAVGAEGLVRVDFMLDEDFNYYMLELNTLPGMTELSLAPMAAKAIGLEFHELVDRIIKSAMER